MSRPSNNRASIWLNRQGTEQIVAESERNTNSDKLRQTPADRRQVHIENVDIKKLSRSSRLSFLLPQQRQNADQDWRRRNAAIANKPKPNIASDAGSGTTS